MARCWRSAAVRDSSDEQLAYPARREEATRACRLSGSWQRASPSFCAITVEVDLSHRLSLLARCKVEESLAAMPRSQPGSHVQMPSRVGFGTLSPEGIPQPWLRPILAPHGWHLARQDGKDGVWSLRVQRAAQAGLQSPPS
ncbi:hypothetical protein L1887_53601 [Cichorium endivia]|nr:hypothetical protein L1887_53601 [Cichorium endivia]